MPKRKTLLIIISIIVISSLILVACGAEGEGLAGAAGGEKGKPEDKKNENDNKKNEDKKNENNNNQGNNDNKNNQGNNDNKENQGNQSQGEVGDEQGADKKELSTKDHGVGHIAVTICHYTGSKTHPYQQITIDKQGELEGHSKHPNDIIPAPPGGCPTDEPPTPPPNEKVTICHATGSATNPYVEITISDQGVLNGHLKHDGDIIPAPAGGCPTAPPPPPPPSFTSLCHANGDGSYTLVTVPDTADLGGHAAHSGDIHPVPANGCPGTPPPPPPPPPTDFTIEPVAPGICVDFVVFHTFRDGDLEIYRLDGVEGQENAVLYNLSMGPDSTDSRPSRSLDNRWVVFESNRDGNIELYLADTLGTYLERLTNTSSNNINPMFMADSETIVFQSDRNGNWDLFSLNMFTYEERQLTTDSNDDVFPFASPDPSWIVYQSNRIGNEDLYLLNVFTGEEYQLTSGTGNEIFPAWSAAGEKIAFLSDEDGDWSLYVVDYNGQNQELVAGGTDINVGNHSWSPDGTRIAYQSEQSGNVDIFTHDFVSGEFYQLTDYVGADSAPSWNCGGETISFTTVRDGDPNVYQVSWQGGDQTYLTNHPATDKWSEWSPSKEQGSRGH
jgi:Tol biopolymer transport system component